MRPWIGALAAAAFASACAPPTPAPRAAAPAKVPAQAPPASGRLRVVAVAAHPDDAETGCGGTLARYAALGHHVTILNLTRGELGVGGQTPEAAGKIRAAESVAACEALGCQAAFFGEKNGSLQLTHETAARLTATLKELAPDVVLTHWPLDTDVEHQMTGILAVRAALALELPGPIYFFEVETGTQTLGFTPTAWVDIAEVRDRKVKAIAAHASQNAEERLYDRHHEPMAKFRGRELGTAAAEAFVVLAPSPVRAPTLLGFEKASAPPATQPQKD